MMTLMCLSLPVAAAQSLAPLNVAELSALLGNFGAVIVTAPASAKRAAIQAVSQLGAASDSDSGFYRGSHTLTVYDLKTPVRLIVGLAGDPIGRGGQAATLSLPGIQPARPISNWLSWARPPPRKRTCPSSAWGWVLGPMEWAAERSL